MTAHYFHADLPAIFGAAVSPGQYQSIDPSMWFGFEIGALRRHTTSIAFMRELRPEFRRCLLYFSCLASVHASELVSQNGNNGTMRAAAVLSRALDMKYVPFDRARARA